MSTGECKEGKEDKYGNLQKHLNPNPLQRLLIDLFHKRVRGLVFRSGAGSILDVGCGHGFTIDAMRREGLRAGVVGVDLSRDALLWGAANLKHDAHLVEGNILHLPFSDGSFELVMSLEVLEHLEDPAQGLRELVRVSAGRCLVSVPHEPFFRGANFLRGKHLRAWGNDPEHLQNFSGAAFRALVGRFLDVEWAGYSFPWQLVLGRKR